jgi:hypothetical protein
MIFAHIAGVPVEELLPAVLPTAAGVVNFVRLRYRRYTLKSRAQSSAAAPR